MQSATFGPTPGSVNNFSLNLFVSFSFSSSSRLISPFNIIFVVSYTLLSLKPNPNPLKSSTDALLSWAGVGNV